MTPPAAGTGDHDPAHDPGEPEVLIGSTPAGAAALAAERLAAAIAAAIVRRGRADIAVTGGSTAPALYRALLARPLRDGIAWDRLHLWFGDDRFVPRRDPDSNLTAVDTVLLAGDQATGLDPAPLPPGNVHPVPVDATLAAGGGPAEAAVAYEAAIVVGIGPDGHLLSIFPGSAAFDAPGWVVPVPSPTHVEPHRARVSLTPGALDATGALLPIAFGPPKATILAEILDGPRDERRLPAQRARRSGATWVLDAAAAGNLPRA